MATQVLFHTGPLQDWGQTWGLGHKKGNRTDVGTSEGDKDTLFFYTQLLQLSWRLHPGVYSVSWVKTFSRRLVT